MSASPMARQATGSQVIPRSEATQLPDGLSSTPGGTIYGTTPGGSKIIYERSFLMSLRESPNSKTPPTCSFPTGMLRGATSPPRPSHPRYNNRRRSSRSASIDENCFSIDL